MSDRLARKSAQYEEMLAEGVGAARIAARPESPLAEVAEEHLEMAESYLRDGRHFRADGDLPNALAAFAYGHGWLDAGARSGVLDVPDEIDIFAI